MRSRYLDQVVQGRIGQRCMQRLYCTHQAADQQPARGGQHLIAHQNPNYVRGRNVGLDVGPHPLLGVAEPGELGDEIIRDGD